MPTVLRPSILLCLAACLCASEAAPDEARTILAGRTASLAMTTAGTADGDLAITFAADTLDGPLLAKAGYTRVPYTLTKTDNGRNWALSARVDAKSGGTLMLTLAITGSRREVLKGSLSLVDKVGNTRTWTLDGKATDASAKRR